MATKWAFAIVLLPLTIANVHVDFNLNEKDNYTLISSGRSTANVDATVISLFSITEERLRNGVGALAGSRPDRVFFSEPMGDLGTPFLHSGWRETRADTILISYNAPQISRRRFKVHGEHYITEDTARTLNIRLTLKHEHEAYHSWGHVPIEESDMKFDYRWVLEGRRPFVYSDDWGSTHNEIMTSETRIETDPITLPPNSNLTVEVFRNSLTVNTTLLYSTHLSGNVVGFWSRGFNGRQFWAYDVQPVLRFGGMPLQAFTTEFVSINYNMGHEVRFRNTKEEDVQRP